MTHALVISVRLHDGRYHGAGDWPPAPARVFQALVAASPKDKDALENASRDALAWLEQLPAPIISAPAKYEGQHIRLFVPNNDLDAKGGDIRRVAEIRSATKHIRPQIFDASLPLLFVWHFDGDDTHAKRICEIANGLYQLGRGVDMAWATAEVLSETEAENCLAEYPGAIYRPSENGNGMALDCPEDGSLESLEIRHKASMQRFCHVQDGRTVRTEFVNAPKPRFHSVTYNSLGTRLLFELRHTTAPGAPFAPWPLNEAAILVQTIRGGEGKNGEVESGAFARLVKNFDRGVMEKILIGRNATEADKALRIRIIPLPSIGHAQVHRSIRRVLVEVPPDCPIGADDVAWAFAGLEITPPVIDADGVIESSPVELVAVNDDSMLAHYGVGNEGESSCLWRSITPLALAAERRRIDPARMKEQAKKGDERQTENRSAINEVMQALRHAGLRHRVINVRVQREPFEAKGERAEAFADGTRFSKHQLWHLEIEFAEAVDGPLLLGNGRYCGLGLMAPIQQVEGVLAFSIVDGLAADAEPLQLTRALRRAVMTRAQGTIGARKKLPTFFTGHEADGSIARRGRHAHLAFVPDLTRQRLLVIAPHVIEHREPFKDERDYLETLARALTGLSELRAGRAGKLKLEKVQINRDSDPLFAPSKVWTTATPYAPTRHAKRNGCDSLHEDVLQEVQRRQLPVPQTVDEKGSDLLLRFSVAVSGPVLLGKTIHFGGGLFKSVSE